MQILQKQMFWTKNWKQRHCNDCNVIKTKLMWKVCSCLKLVLEVLYSFCELLYYFIWNRLHNTQDNFPKFIFDWWIVTNVIVPLQITAQVSIGLRLGEQSSHTCSLNFIFKCDEASLCIKSTYFCKHLASSWISHYMCLLKINVQCHA